MISDSHIGADKKTFGSSCISAYQCLTLVVYGINTNGSDQCNHFFFTYTHN